MYSELIKKLKSINHHFIVDNIGVYMDRNKDKILKLAKDRMMRGDGVDGGIIGSYKSKSYELFKDGLNPLAGGTVDLFLTGSLQAKMTIIDDNNLKFEIISTDDKYEMLADKYGADQFGLTQEQKEQVINEGMNYLINEIYKNYG